MSEIEFVDFNTSFKDELNSWTEIEKERGESGLERFVLISGTKLGDLIEYMTKEMNVISKIALHDKNIVGFVCYDVKDENNTAHIEIVGTNPKFRKQGYTKKILLGVKDLINETHGIEKISLSVNRNNQAGLNSFSKFANKNEALDSENYIGFEL